ncbi:MAG: photosystem II protein Psb27 [Synechococcaceae cyanobacterium]|jgi:photosystem II Psb27 protein
MVAFLRRTVLRTVVALCLCFTLALSACSASGTGLTGNYVDDTVRTAQTLLTTIATPQDDPGHAAAEAQARAMINDWTSRYRPRGDLRTLTSFTTMQTALNSLAGHYANYANRPLPEALRTRLEKELHKAETTVTRGA